MTDHYTATLDRIVDETTAVLLLEDEGSVVDERTVDVERLPLDGRHDGAVFDVELADGSLRAVTHRPDAERDRRERLQDRFDRLSERPPDDDS
ncbi:DUF3006 domain-containing protein [Halosolutus amylolyticus]|uniref:DUF3006 domain-containing protein n=1 Tax=Halosolutus amylolyticus TaxID=2932267 RepID=A0ABD5PS34_9EURY|nr:DUF3006 domain-containing protein [Halosolutus amylolyticus]